MKRFLLSCVVVCVLLCVFTTSASAGSLTNAGAVTDTISVYVGYYGTEYYEKCTYHWAELDDLFGGALDTYEIAYSYYNGSRTAIDSARGFLLSDFLSYAGVDFSSIAAIDFYTKDHTNGAYRSFTKYSLIDAPRYFFPNLAADEETGEPIARDGVDVWNGALLVETMLALEDHWEWDAEDTYFAAPSTGNRFRLLFGQLYPSEAMTSASAKYVHTLYVTFSGMPILTAEEPDMPLVVGSDYSVTVNVSAEDSLLDEYVRENLVWSSNNTDVIEVDFYGNLTVKAEGEAVITVSFGDASSSITVKAGSDENLDGTGTDSSETDGEGTGQGNGQDNGQSNGQSTVQDNGQGSGQGIGQRPSENGADVEGTVSGDIDFENAENQIMTEEIPDERLPLSENTVEEVSFSENNSGVYLLSSEAMSRTEFAEWVNSILEHEAVEGNGTGGVVNWRTEGLDDDAQALAIQIRSIDFMPICLGFAVVFLLGAITGVTSFYIHLNGIFRKKQGL